jgi:carboxymethylenebutenolidase
MGGMLSLLLATQQGDKLSAVVAYYGAPLDDGPDWANLAAPVRGYFAGQDDFFPPAKVRELEAKLEGMGKDVSFEVYADNGHAFCNEENALGTYDADAAADTWAKTIAFLHAELD